MRILYGIPSEGMGHATRSKVIIQHLLKHHDVRIVTSDRAYRFLSKEFPGKVYPIEGLHLSYKDGEISKFKTFSDTLRHAPQSLKANLKQFRHTHQFHPELVISDFESFSYFYAKTHKLPIISIDNMQVIDRCKLDIAIPKEEKSSHQLAKKIIQLKVPRCNHYLVSGFFQPEVSKKNTTLVPPILRESILASKPQKGEHILVYQTSTSQKNLIKVLQEVPSEQFYVYGFNKSEQHGNVTLLPFSEQQFIDHLASAKAVLSNGGYSLLSEAVYLQKPVLSVPIAGQFEQFVNAAYIEKENYGHHFSQFTSDHIKAFLFDLDRFEKSLERYTQKGNSVLLTQLDQLLTTLA